MAFRLLNQKPVYFDTDGVTPCASGSLVFSVTGTSTAKNVYADPDLNTSNGSTVSLDAAGRPSVDVWGSGEYRVTLKNSDGTTVWTQDNVRDVATGGLTIPALTDGEFLTNDGSALSWAAILQVPDPTGNSGKILGNDGTNSIWQSVASLNIPAITASLSSSGYVKFSGIMFQWGSGTAAASGGRYTTASVTFGTAFDSSPYIVVPVVNSSSVSSYENNVAAASTTESSTGATFRFTVGEIDDSQSGYNITSTVAFKYLAIGPKA